MRSYILSFGRIALILSCPSLLHAQAPAIEKVTPPALLKPLPIQAQGRVALAPDGLYTYQWPGPYFVATYKGAALYFKVGSGKQNLHIAIDNANATSLLTDGAPSTYRIATPGAGTHTVRIDAVNENQDAPRTLGAFAIPASGRFVTLYTSARQIEFIGDSHTVGYGNMSSTGTCTQGQVWATTDTSRSIGADVARHYHADYQLVAISGRGVVRNWNGTQPPLLPAAYPYALLNSDHPDTRQPYADPAWHPSVLVVSLGTNDYSTDLHAGEPWKTRADLDADFEAHYAAFLHGLRDAHPHALIVVWATDLFGGNISAEARKTVTTLQNEGDTRLDFIDMTGLAFSGCHGHPSAADDQRIADKLVTDIDSRKHVW